QATPAAFSWTIVQRLLACATKFQKQVSPQRRGTTLRTDHHLPHERIEASPDQRVRKVDVGLMRCRRTENRVALPTTLQASELSGCRRQAPPGAFSLRTMQCIGPMCEVDHFVANRNPAIVIIATSTTATSISIEPSPPSGEKPK